ncbi:MAG: preprotein translocase subunit SecE [Candidatus Nealsonbacteria bacterium RBG_13_42_11]|uniref:Protein translocase subunit SecE n=1 Tax=Candidatus Nealsonbacteria bacterium RBG_13_42_11 TaxID=1801663 RepID=A0A1G2DZ03_9BACT|nr:MAG: preprotein translocase subunit SecE [Candidatus Nealsonbacteria bacterium RBG_13_42_11]
MNLANIPNKIIEFLKQVRLEMKKVNWPTRGETVKYTLIVIGVSVVIAAYLGGLDVLINTLLEKFIIK